MHNHLKRCEHCNAWTDGNKTHCEHCRGELNEVYKREVKAREDQGDPRLPIIQIKANDPTWVKIAKRPIQLVQLVAYAIIAFLVYLTTIFAH